MSASRITITFTEDLPLGAQLGFTVSNQVGTNPPVLSDRTYNWVVLRSGPNQVTTGTPTEIAGERAAINFVSAFTTDTGTSFQVVRVANIVTIRALNNSGNRFTKFFVVSPSPNYTNHPSIEFDIANGTDETFVITDISFSAADENQCTKVKMTVTTNEVAYYVDDPIEIVGNEDNPLEFEVLRGQNTWLRIRTGGLSGISRQVVTPPLLSAENIQLTINNSPFGATIIATAQNMDGLEIEYSLDNVTWREEGLFAGIEVGTHNLYVRDQYGCVKSVEFEIVENGIYSPYFYISKSNSLRFANRVIWGDSANYKNDENTLSNEVNVPLPTTEVQRFNTSDVITTQFKSNYSSHEVKIYYCNGDQTVIDSVDVVQKTENIGATDKRDARLINLGDGKNAIYFLSGNRYDYETDEIIGEYALNGSLPAWATEGNYLSIEASYYEIEQVVFDESRNAQIVVFTGAYSGTESNVVAGAMYNLFNYEVFEFPVDMDAYRNKKLRVEIVASDVRFPSVTLLSEIIHVKDRHEKTLEIRYYNTSNNDVFYATGIQHLIRIPYITKGAKPSGEFEAYKTDTNTSLLSAELYEADEFVFEPLTREIWRKLMIALSSEVVTIDGVGYTRDGDYSSEGPLGQTDDYVLTAQMVKTGAVHTNKSSGGDDFSTGNIEIPGLIESETGFIQY